MATTLLLIQRPYSNFTPVLMIDFMTKGSHLGSSIAFGIFNLLQSRTLPHRTLTFLKSIGH